MDLATMQSIWSKLNGWVSGLKDLKTLPDYKRHPLPNCIAANIGLPANTVPQKIPDTCGMFLNNININIENPMQMPVFENDTDSYILPIHFSGLTINGNCALKCILQGDTDTNATLKYTRFETVKYDSGMITFYLQWNGTFLFPSMVCFSVEAENTGTDDEYLLPNIYCSDHGDQSWRVNGSRICDILTEAFKLEILQQLYQGLGK